jgi:oligosaccharide repeat unit polymerase
MKNIAATNSVYSPASYHQLKIDSGQKDKHILGLNIVVTHFIITVFIATFCSIYWIGTILPNRLLYPISIGFTALFIWSLWSWRAATKDMFHPYLIFLLIPAYLFNGGQAFLEVFRLNKYGMLGGQVSSDGLFAVPSFSQNTLDATLLLVLLSLSSLHLGALLTAARRKTKLVIRTSLHLPKAQNLRMIGWFLLTISIPAWAFVIRGFINVRISEGYAGLYQQNNPQGIDNWPLFLSTFLIPGAIFLLAGSKDQIVGVLVSGFCICLLSIAWFFLGARSTAIMPVIGYAWVFHTCIRPLPATLILIPAAVMLFVLFPLIGVLRSSRSVELSYATLSETYFSIDTPVVSIISEMGDSMRPVAHTLELVPSQRPFDFGIGYLHALLSAIPNFVTPLHFDLEYRTPDLWLTDTVDPARAAAGGAIGYSFIAEAYLAFGWIGAPIMLALVGAFIVKLATWATNELDLNKVAMLGTFLSFVPHYTRGTTEELTRPFLWYSLIPYLLVLIIVRSRAPKEEEVADKRTVLLALLTLLLMQAEPGEGSDRETNKTLKI